MMGNTFLHRRVLLVADLLQGSKTVRLMLNSVPEFQGARFCAVPPLELSIVENTAAHEAIYTQEY